MVVKRATFHISKASWRGCKSNQVAHHMPGGKERDSSCYEIKPAAETRSRGSLRVAEILLSAASIETIPIVYASDCLPLAKRGSGESRNIHISSMCHSMSIY